MHRYPWLALCFVGCASNPRPVALAAALPAIELTRVDGGGESLKAALGGSVAVIDLWATWCTACEQQRPKLERLHAAYFARGLRVIGLDVGETASVLNAYLVDHRTSYPIYLDPDFRVADALGEKRLPRLLVIDREGRIIRRSPALDAQTLATIKAQLAPAP